MEPENIVEKLMTSELHLMLIKEPTNYIKTVTEIESFSYIDKIGIFSKNEPVSIRIFPLHYEDGQADIKGELVQSRFNCVKEIYYRWCALKKLKPNPNEGWFRSKKFTKYLDELNFQNMNYVVVLTDLKNIFS